MATCAFNQASLLIFLCILSFLFVHCNSTDFQVGDAEGWKVPSPKNSDFYNKWAEKKRFKVNDTLQFQYKKDSVMVVTDVEYEKCRSPQPIFFFNKGDTIFEVNRSGLFYFMSGVTGHCEKGQKMIIKVLDLVTPQQPSPAEGSPDDKNKKNGAAELKFMGVSSMLCMLMSYLIMV